MRLDERLAFSSYEQMKKRLANSYRRPVLRALSVITRPKNRDQGCALDPRRRGKDQGFHVLANRKPMK
jgi:hypothetical protein